MGFLARPVTADHTHDDAGNSEEQQYEYDSLHHASVPLACPRYSAIAIAEMNMPVMM